MPRDLSDAFGWLEKLERKISRLYSGAMLENSSITNGRMRFIGGLLRLDSGARLEGEGNFSWSGPIYLDGDVQVTKTLDVTAETRLRGETTIEAIARLLSELVVEGKITAGDVRIEDGKIYAGGMVIDPNDAGGSVVFPGGAKVTANDGSPGVKIESGTGWVAYVAQYGIRFSGAAGDSSVTIAPDVVAVTSDNIQLASSSLNLNAGTADIGDVTHWLGLTASGAAKWVSKSQGGPTGSGEFRWPFPLAFVSREYGPGYAEYDDGVHKGIDFSGGPAVGGAPIPASSGGTVIDKAFDSERGNYVILSHGNRGGFELTTRYYHLSGSSPLSVGDTVAKGQTLGLVGTTGLSDGNHLHFETRRNGEHMNPRSFMEIYGE